MAKNNTRPFFCCLNLEIQQSDQRIEEQYRDNDCEDGTQNSYGSHRVFPRLEGREIVRHEGDHLSQRSPKVSEGISRPLTMD